MAKRNPSKRHRTARDQAAIVRAHDLLVKRRKASRAGAPRINPATKRVDRAYR